MGEFVLKKPSVSSLLALLEGNFKDVHSPKTFPYFP